MASKVNIVINGKNLASKAIKDVTKDLSDASGASNKFNDGMMKLAKFGLGSAIAAATAVIGGSFASLKKSADFSDIRMQFDTLLGSYSEAEKMLTSLQGLAAKTPLQLTAVTEAATQLLAVGTDKNLITGELRMLGDLAMGNEQKFGLLTDAYAKLRAKGKVSLEELNRFTENGVPLLGSLAKNLGVSNAELQKMVSTGKIKLKDIQQAMKDLTEEGGMFFGMMEKKSQGVNGKLSTLKDNLAMTMVKWGTAFEPLAGNLLDTAIQKLNDFSTSDSFKKFIETTVRWASWASETIPKIGLVLGFVGDVIAITIRHARAELEKIGSMIIKLPLIQAGIKWVGDAWAALKKGFTTGDWSDAIGVGMDIFRSGIVISTVLTLLSTAGSGLLSSVQLALSGAGFLKKSGLGTAGVLAAMNIAVGLVEAKENGDWAGFGKNILAGLAAGLGVGLLTGNAGAGAMAFNLVMGLKLGEIIFSQESLDRVVDSVSWAVGRVVITFGKIKDASSEAFQWVSEKASIFSSSAADSFRWAMDRIKITFENTKGSALEAYSWIANQAHIFAGNASDSFSWAVERIVITFGNIKNAIGSIDMVGIFSELWNTKIPSFLTQMLENGKLIGSNLLEGFRQGILNAWDSVINTVGSFFSSVLNRGKKVLDEHSPSKEAESMGSFFIEGFANGINAPSWREEITSSWNNLLENLRNTGKIDVDGTLDNIYGKSSSAGAGGGSEKSWISTIFSKFTSGFQGLLTSLSSFKALLDPVSTILSGVMSVLEPIINKALAPLLGILTIIGKTIGGVLSPVFELLAAVTEIVGKAFVWFYNKAILPVGNGFITIFNILYNAVAAVINGIGNALKWLGVRLSMDYRSLDAGKLQAIDYSSLTASASSYTGSSSAGGSSSSVNQVTVNYYQTINGNVIGDAGMANLGEFFVKAVEAYIGSGGTVRFIQETA